MAGAVQGSLLQTALITIHSASVRAIFALAIFEWGAIGVTGAMFFTVVEASSAFFTTVEITSVP
jgi:hypothetical protein